MTATTIGIIISMVTILVSVVIYFLNKRESQTAKNRTQEIARIDNVVDEYMKLYDSRENKGIDALYQAGIRNLTSDTEIYNAIRTIENRTGKSPLGQFHSRIKNIGFNTFFKNITRDQLRNPGLETALRQLESN